jgi:hypothetical protein
MGSTSYTAWVRTFPSARALAGSLALLLAVTLVPLAERADAATVVRTPTDPVFTVRLRSDAAGHVWKGSMRVAFRHRGADPLDRLYLRLWSNGVQGCSPLAIRISDLQGGTVRPLQQRCTTARVDLEDAVAPGDRGMLRFSLEIRLPKRNDRFGYLRGLALLGSALPALAVHDDAGWNLPPFVDLGESFYSVTGTYRVTLNTPAKLQTPTTGIRTDRTVRGTRTIDTYTARRVRDFEWAAGRLARLVGSSGQTRVNVWYQPEAIARKKARAMLRHAERSMDTFSAAFGTYPYREIDVVLTGFATFGGMEYPTLVFSNPDTLTIAHELAHQWWYGTVGNDQFTEPWLDEGLASWSQFLPTNPWRRCGGFTWPSASARMTNDMGYWRDHPDEYGQVVYFGGACLLAQLAQGFGLPRFTRLLGRYATTHRYGIARTEDLRRIVDRTAARHWPSFDPATFWASWRVD